MTASFCHSLLDALSSVQKNNNSLYQASIFDCPRADVRLGSHWGRLERPSNVLHRIHLLNRFYVLQCQRPRRFHHASSFLLCRVSHHCERGWNIRLHFPHKVTHLADYTASPVRHFERIKCNASNKVGGLARGGCLTKEQVRYSQASSACRGCLDYRTSAPTSRLPLGGS